MRAFLFAAALTLSACAAPGGTTVGTFLIAADAATSLVVERMTVEETTFPAGEGMDPLVVLKLHRPDGRALVFQQANHTPHDIFVQTAGGPLAQIMGLPEDASPLLYRATPQDNIGAPFLCAPDGPLLIGYQARADGVVQIVGLKQEFQVELRPDGQTEAVPYSPAQVCARLQFRRS